MLARTGDIDWAEEALAASEGAGESGWLKQAQDEAASRLGNMGMPGRRDEYWKYTRPDTLVQPVPPAAGSRNQYWKFQVEPGVIWEPAPSGIE